MNFTVNKLIHRAMLTIAMTTAILGTTSGLLLGIFLTTANPASAKQFQKLLQVGQTVPGNNQPVEDIIEPTIGLDQQVAVLLKTKSVQTNPTTTTTFKGIYSIGKEGQVRLMDGGASRIDPNGGNRREFSAPSISQGKIAYLSISQSGGRGGFSNQLTDVRVGTPGQVRTALSLNLAAVPAVSGLDNLAFVNGKAYLLDTNAGSVGVIDTLATTPSLVSLRPGRTSAALRASATSLLVTDFIPGQVPNVSLLESSGDANFTQVPVPESISGNCGVSVSFDNVVACTRQRRNEFPIAKIFVRFGRGSAFTTIPIPPNTVPVPPLAERVSISNRSVIFFSKQLRATSPNFVDTIYLSDNGQKPTAVVKAGDMLDGKTVSELALSQNGRTIAGKSIVFTATFTDNTRALYRVDL